MYISKQMSQCRTEVRFFFPSKNPSAKLLLRTWLIHALLIALFPGLPIIKFLIACSMQKMEGEGLVHFIAQMMLVSTQVDGGRDSRDP